MSQRFELRPFGRIIWEDRYGLKNENGDLIEKDIFDTFRRVAKAIASKEKYPEVWEKEFYDIMAGGYFCPAGRILAHAGTHYPQLLNCFVLPFEDDSLESIMATARNTAIVQKYGGGVGINYSTLRPSGSYIKGVNGRSCGVLGFMNMMSTLSEVIEQGGSRRGANMGLLEVWHPDIWEYISYKTEHNWDKLVERNVIDIKDEDSWASFKFENLYKLQMYNISIGITDEFLKAVREDAYWPLVWKDKEWQLYTVEFNKVSENKIKKIEVTADNEKTAIWKAKKKIPYPSIRDTFKVVNIRRIKAVEIWDKACFNAWADGCPGVINLSTARRMHNLEYIHPISASNPCAEQMLPAMSSCNLASLNLPMFLEEGSINFDLMRKVITIAVRFADNVIDNCMFPLDQIKEKALKERRVGLGVMGVHDFLIALKLPYDSDEGRAEVEKVIRFIRDAAYEASVDLAEEKGAFPVFDRDKFLESGFIKTLPEEIRKKIYDKGIRNSTLISIAPTGTIGTMYGVSTGCEPWFSLSFQRNTRLGSFEEGCPAYIQWKKNHPNESKPLYFKTSQEIFPEDHIKMLLLFSKYTDSSISKTINLPNSATVDDVKKAYIFAMENGAKGITIFREGSKEGVLVNREKIIEEARKAIHNLQDMKEEKTIDTRLFPKKRGNRAVGATYRVHLQNHNLYVTVNRNKDGELVEIFATVGESKKPNPHHTSGVEDSWAEGLAKTVSLALRAGVKPQAVIRNLKNIPSDKPVFTTIGDNETSELIPSPPHAIARIIEEELKYEMESIKNKDIAKDLKYCNECGSNNIKFKSSTCYVCDDCGYSGCG